MESPNVTAVLFAKNFQKLADFYSHALGFQCTHGDEDHAILNCRGFELIVHQIPKHIADQIVIAQPPERRTSGAVRLDYPVQNIEHSRTMARSFGGAIDDAPPGWADRNANFFFGYDPEGNQFGVSQQAC
jgi:hypothetical protein